MSLHEFTVPPSYTRQRIDQYLAESDLGLSRSQIKNRLLSVTLNKKTAKLSSECAPGDILLLELKDEKQSDLEPENLNIPVIFENEDVLVVDKPAGMVVHPALGNQSGTLVHGLLYHFSELRDQDFEDEGRPGIVHRLDKDTSGVLIVAKNPASHEFLAGQFQERTTQKWYLCIVKGRSRITTRTIEGFIKRDPRHRQKFVHDPNSGKTAKTTFFGLAAQESYQLLLAKPFSGRTHQIRVHARELGLPILGDPIYSREDPGFKDLRLMLHAWKLGIRLPGSTQTRFFEAPLPEDFMRTLKALGLEKGLEKAESYVLNSGDTSKS